VVLFYFRWWEYLKIKSGKVDTKLKETTMKFSIGMWYMDYWAAPVQLKREAWLLGYDEILDKMKECCLIYIWK
jgi:hypothetical protein